MDANSIIELRSEAKRRRVNIEQDWIDLFKFFRPGVPVGQLNYKGTVIPRRDDKNIFESTAIWSVDTAVAGLFSFITPPTTPWIMAVAEDPRFDKQPEVTRWLYDVRALVFSMMTRMGSRLYVNLPTYYRSLLLPGTAWLFVDSQPENISVNVRSVGELFNVDDETGRNIGVIRPYYLKGHQLLRMFPDAPLEVRRRAEKGLYDQFSLTQWIGPEDIGDAGSRIENVHLFEDDKTVLRRSWYRDYPVVTDRWAKEPDCEYGYSQAMTVLGDVKSMQSLMKSSLRGIAKMADPVTLVNNRALFGKEKPVLDAGTMVRLNRSIGSPGTRDIDILHQGTGALNSVDFLEYLANRVHRAFYVDALRELGLRGQSSPLKAEEVRGRREEIFRLFAPVVVERTANMLNPLAAIYYNAANRQGLIPDPPRAFSGQRFTFEFTSTAALAQRRHEVDDTLGFLTSATPLFNLDPEVRKNLDTDKLFRKLAWSYNIDPSVLNDPGTVTREREMQAQREQAAMLLAGAEGAGNALESLSKVGV